jgi:hypothetical protein
MSNLNASEVSGPSARPADRIFPIDLDAMRTEAGWFEAPRWPCSVAEVAEIQRIWWQTVLDFVLESGPGIERDAIILGVTAIIVRTVSLAETAFALECAEAAGMDLVGGPPETDYLRGNWTGPGIPHDNESDTKRIVAARHPLIRSFLSTRRFAPTWKIPYRLAAHRGKVIAHNDLLFPMARASGIPMVFDDAGAMFNNIRQSYSSNPVEDQAGQLAQALTDRMVNATAIDDPYRTRLNNLVHARLSRILQVTLSDMQATQKAKLPDLIWGNTGSQYAARAIAIEILNRGGETRFFTHAGTASMVHKPATFALGELAVSSTFVMETQAAAEHEEMSEACQIMAPLHKTKIIGASGNKAFLNLPLRRQGSTRKRPKVIYVGMPSWGAHGYGSKGLPEVIFLDWQFRLVRFLNTLPIDLICKPHPGGYFSGQQHPIENFTSTDYGKFEALMEQTDVFIFDGCMTTTIWEALCTDRKLVYFELGAYQFYKAADAMFQRRASIIKATYDDDNRPHFDPEAARAAILDNSAVDPSEFQRALIGDTV